MPPKPKPGGRRFPPRSTAKSQLPHQIQPPTSSSEASSSGLNPEAEDKFELELCWCIQQLELSMTSNKMGDKQVHHAQKNLKLLKSNNVPLIQKRQIMRTTFGDYRAKMQQEEKKHSRASASAKISTPQPSANKCVFVRKAQGTLDDSLSETNGQVSNDQAPKLSELFKQNQDNEPFKFNFNSKDASES